MGEITFGGVSLNIITVIVTIGVAWGISKKTNESQDEKIKENADRIEKLFDYKDKHEEEAGKERLLLHQNISKLEGILEFRGRENVEIMKQIEKINLNIETIKDDMSEIRIKRRNK